MKRSWPAIALCGSLLACGSGGGSSGSSGSSGAAPATSSTAAAAGTTAAAPASGTAEAPSVPGTPSGGGIAGPATEDGAKAAIAQLQNAADPMVELKKLKPGLEEIKALFPDPATAEAVSQQVEKAFAKGGKDDFPKGAPLVFCAKSDDVKAWTPEVNKHFPGGYKRLKDKLNSGITMCKFKIGGVAFDSLVNIKGNWFLIAKPFRAIHE